MNSDIDEKLKAAVIEGNFEQVKALIDAGADVNCRSKDHCDTALHYAPSSKIANLLILNKADVNVADSYGQTPLCCAVAKKNRLEVVKVLLNAGASVNVKMLLGNTPLHYAHTVEINELLLQNGAMVNATDNYGRTPLRIALTDGKRLGVVRSLISAGADVHEQMGPCQNSLLHYTDSLDITRELLSHGIDVNVVTSAWQTPLHNAVRQMKGLAIVRELLKSGAHVNERDMDGNTALVYAVKSRWKDLDVIKELLVHGACINEIYFDLSARRFCTILNYAIHHDLDCAKLMFKIYLIIVICYKEGETIEIEHTIPFDRFEDFSGYVQGCIREISRMKEGKVICNLNLYELIKKGERVRPLYSSYRNLEKEILSKYPIYHDIIMPKIKLGLERGLLLTKFRGLQLSIKSVVCNQKGLKNEVTLNSDCTYMIAEMLSDDDIKNLLIVFELCNHSQK